MLPLNRLAGRISVLVEAASRGSGGCRKSTSHRSGSADFDRTRDRDQRCQHQPIDRSRRLLARATFQNQSEGQAEAQKRNKAMRPHLAAGQLLDAQIDQRKSAAAGGNNFRTEVRYLWAEHAAQAVQHPRLVCAQGHDEDCRNGKQGPQDHQQFQRGPCNRVGGAQAWELKLHRLFRRPRLE